MFDLRSSYDKLVMFHVNQCNKHQLHNDALEYAYAQINNLNNVELIEQLILWGHTMDSQFKYAVLGVVALLGLLGSALVHDSAERAFKLEELRIITSQCGGNHG